MSIRIDFCNNNLHFIFYFYVSKNLQEGVCTLFIIFVLGDLYLYCLKIKKILNVRHSHHSLFTQRPSLPSRIRHLSRQERSLFSRSRHQLFSHPRCLSTHLLIQKKAITKLQEGRTVKKIVQLDKHIHMAFSGLTADGRILANKARI